MDAELRPPGVVMRLSRLGSSHQCRLSFMRQLLRRLAAEEWRVERRAFDIDDRGVGHAVYAAVGPARSYSLVAFAHDLPDHLRSDRVIAEEWDATFALYDGVPTDADIERLRANVPLQEAGRVGGSELSLSRANRSVRLWNHVVERLSEGKQPDAAKIERVGYLMRTTAVYGSGKFGAADRERVKDRPELAGPFQAEMLSVWLTRTFVRDLVNHLAAAAGGRNAAPLDPRFARMLGIGNSTGLGMAPFIVNHPVLFNNWIMAREEALARVRALPRASADEVALVRDLVDRLSRDIAHWPTDHPAQMEKNRSLAEDLPLISERLAADSPEERPWDALCAWAEERLSEEGQELLNSLVMEPYPSLVDGLADRMSDDVEAGFRVDGSMTVAALRDILRRNYDWALKIDWSAPESVARAWYVSEEKLEPRLGERHEEDIAEFEQPLAPGRDAARLFTALDALKDGDPVASLLRAAPEHRLAVRRAQIAAIAPYAEIRDNTISADLLPIDMLRAKLSFFGATRFDPRSDRWVRINMYRNAPYPEDLETARDDWVYPA